MKVIYVLLSIAGWVWLVVAAGVLWWRTRRVKSEDVRS